ncbi:MAG TPA: Uma2 family endonuclease [Gemmatimonadales bacterium]|nr:Uma2 family endonuclease [Gemmatimonadales bacterium]
MPDTARRYTVEQVLAFPHDGNRYELVHGELLVSPAPRYRHQVLVTRLVMMVGGYLQQHPGLAEVLVSPADITWGTEDDLAQPDVFVVPQQETSEEWSAIRTLLLAIEVLSPSTARYDRITKRRLYQEHGVVTYWVVDPDARLVEVWHPGDERPEIVTERLVWSVTSDGPEMVMDLHRLFG